MIWDEFLRHFRFCDEEDSGLSDEEQERKGQKKSPKAHTKTDTSSQEKLFGEIQNSFLMRIKLKSALDGYDFHTAL